MSNRRRVLALVAVLCAVLALPWHSFLGSVEAQSGTAIQVDVAANRRPIDPRVYGVNWATAAQLAVLNVPVHRWGGNSTTRHNWKTNGDNRGSDWYFESIPGQRRPPGAAFDSFVQAAKQNGAEPMVTIPIIGWVGKNGPGGTQARQLLRRQVRRAAGLRLELVPRRLQRRPHERHQRHRQRPQRRERGVERPVPEGVGPAPRRPLGRRRERRRALLHLRQRAQPLAPHPPRRAPGRPDHDRAAGPDDRLRHRDPAGRPRRGLRGARGVGLVGLLLLRLRPEVRQRHRVLVLRPGQGRERRRGLHAVAPRPDAPARAEHRATACSTSSPCTTTRRAASSATTPRPSMQAAAQPLHPLAVGPELHGRDVDRRQGPPHPADEGVGGRLLPRPRDRHHRVQLGRRRPHQRRHRPGRRPRHLRPRGPQRGHPLGGPGHEHPDVQGHPDVPQLRRQQVRLRRRQRQGHGPQPGQPGRLRRRAVERRRRSPSWPSTR